MKINITLIIVVSVAVMLGLYFVPSTQEFTNTVEVEKIVETDDGDVEASLDNES